MTTKKKVWLTVGLGVLLLCAFYLIYVNVENIINYAGAYIDSLSEAYIQQSHPYDDAFLRDVIIGQQAKFAFYHITQSSLFVLFAIINLVIYIKTIIKSWKK